MSRGADRDASRAEAGGTKADRAAKSPVEELAVEELAAVAPRWF